MTGADSQQNNGEDGWPFMAYCPPDSKIIGICARWDCYYYHF